MTPALPGMRGWIVVAQVGLGLDDTACHPGTTGMGNQDRPQQVTSDLWGGTVKEFERKN
jgi:hypothetical protein